jgi:hypothetical protein
MYLFAFESVDQPLRGILRGGLFACEMALTAIAFCSGMLHNGCVTILRRFPE